VKVLVTGGRGVLGSHVGAALREAGHEPAPLGRADWRPEIALEEGVRRTLDRLRRTA